MTFTRQAFLRAALSFAAASTLLASCQRTDAPSVASAPETSSYEDNGEVDATLYLVRHAEKELEGDDPALSPAGEARAEDLARTLRDVKFDGIYSTDTRRTRDTAAPLVAQTGLSLQFYNGRELTEFAQQLSELNGHYLIVGHSNTTPQLVEALGGEGGDPIVEADEFDRLYEVKLTGGIVVTELKRYP